MGHHRVVRVGLAVVLAACGRLDFDSTCGNGILDPGEACDDGAGNGRGQGACLADCSAIQLCPLASQQAACRQNEVGGDGAPTSSGLTAPVVLFQPDFASAQPNAGQPAVQRGGANQVYTVGIYVDPQDNQTKLLVNDRLNNRVLIYNHVPLLSQALPDVVVGQTDFTSGLANAGQAAPNAIGFHANVHVSVCGTGEMFVTDSINNRIMVWRKIPTSNGTPADFVLGQPDFTSNAAGTAAAALNSPHGAQCIARKLVIADAVNNRILIYDPIPASTGELPARVIGQPDFTTAAAACSATGLFNPYEVLVHDGLVYVADGNNARVLVYDDSFWTSATPAALAVLGQPDLTHCMKNQGLAAPAATTLSSPNSLTARDDILAVSDHDNDRIVFYRLPVASGAAGIALIGHGVWTDNTLIAPPTGDSVYNSKGIVFDGDYLWIGDNRNNRARAEALPAF